MAEASNGTPKRTGSARAARAMPMTGITSIDGSSASCTGNAATVTNGEYTTTIRTIGGCIIDSISQVTVGYNKIFAGEVSYAMTIDTIIFQGYGAALDVTLKVAFGKDMSAAGTIIVTAGNEITSVSTATKISSFNNAAIGAGCSIWIYPSAVATKGNQIGVIIKGHRT